MPSLKYIAGTVFKLFLTTCGLHENGCHQCLMWKYTERPETAVTCDGGKACENGTLQHKSKYI